MQKEAKLGEQNRFFFDKERGIWREEGAEVPDAAAPLPPPPTSRKAVDSMPASAPGAYMKLPLYGSLWKLPEMY